MSLDEGEILSRGTYLEFISVSFEFSCRSMNNRDGINSINGTQIVCLPKLLLGGSLMNQQNVLKKLRFS